jgi:mono/diheme cytochrome c family protein
MGKRSLLPRAAAAVALMSAVPVLSACGVKDKEADVVAGKQLFVQKCGSCHTLGRAGTKGTAGPNLDDAFQQAVKEDFGVSAIRGVVYQQILHPNRRGSGLTEKDLVKMPAGLVKGDKAHDVAAYVAMVAAQPGKDAGLLATAVAAAGAGKPVDEKNGVLSIAADPNGQLAYVTKKANATAGPVKIESPNKSGTPHDIVIDGLGKGAEVANGGVSQFTATLEAGKTYTYYCSLPGHRPAGMEGTITVK